MSQPLDPYLDETFKLIASKFTAFTQEPAPRSTTTFTHDLLKTILQRMEDVPDSAAAQVYKIVDTLTFPEQDEILDPYQKDPRTLELLALVDKADARHQLAFMSFAAEGYLISPDVYGHMVATAEPLEAAKSLKGEARARTVIPTVGTIGELVYQPFLQAIRALSLCAQGQAVTPAPSFGRLVKDMAKNLPGSTLVDPDAGWMRNSAAHGRWRYWPQTDSLEMWDLHHDPQVFKVDDVIARISEWHLLAMAIMYKVYRLNCKKHWHVVWTNQWKPALLAKVDRKAKKSLEPMPPSFPLPPNS